jgi:hypothetical protein
MLTTNLVEHQPSLDQPFLHLLAIIKGLILQKFTV